MDYIKACVWGQQVGLFFSCIWLWRFWKLWLTFKRPFSIVTKVMRPQVSLFLLFSHLFCRLSEIIYNSYLFIRVVLFLCLYLLLHFFKPFGFINNFFLMQLDLFLKLSLLFNIQIFQILVTILPYTVEDGSC